MRGCPNKNHFVDPAFNGAEKHREDARRFAPLGIKVIKRVRCDSDRTSVGMAELLNTG